MNAGDEGSSAYKIKIPRDLYEEIGNQQRIIRLIKVGLLSLKIISFEKEIADLKKRTEDSKKEIAELPSEIQRFQQLLEDALKDQKILERLLGEKG
jgi:predicted RNase H-like nuclease (RuvC/YqgF family)